MRTMFTFHFCFVDVCVAQMNGFYSICSSVVKWQFMLTFKFEFKFKCTNIAYAAVFIYINLIIRVSGSYAPATYVTCIEYVCYYYTAIITQIEWSVPTL